MSFIGLYHWGVQLSDTSETTNLGIIINSKVRFDKHITSMVRKAHIIRAAVTNVASRRVTILSF